MLQIRKPSVKIGLWALLGCAIIVAAILLTQPRQPVSASNPTVMPAMATVAPPLPPGTYSGTTNRRDGYIVKTVNGKVTVYAAAHPELPILVTDIAVSSLRAGDQKLLEAGIAAANDAQLHQLIEDFGP